MFTEFYRRSPFIAGVAGAVVGVVVTIVLWHFWIDHRSLHQLIQIENDRFAAQVAKPK